MSARPFPTSVARWPRWWFRGAAVYGVIALALAALAPPPTSLLDHYGFILTALAFQGVFWIIGGDLVRYRAMMPWAVAEKLAFGVPCAVLFAAGRVDAATLAFGAIDLVLGAGFLIAWRSTAAA